MLGSLRHARSHVETSHARIQSSAAGRRKSFPGFFTPGAGVQSGLTCHSRSLRTSPETVRKQACRRHFSASGTISGTYQNLPSSKPWAIGQAFCSKSADFGPLEFRRNLYEQGTRVWTWSQLNSWGALISNIAHKGGVIEGGRLFEEIRYFGLETIRPPMKIKYYSYIAWLRVNPGCRLF